MPSKNKTDQSELITLAIEGIDAQIRALTEKRAQFTALISEAPVASRAVGRPRRSSKAKADSSPAAKPRRTMSAATRKKLKEAAKERWARVKAEKGGQG